MEEETSNPKDLFENMNSDNLNEEQTDDDQGQFINSCLPNSGANCNSFREAYFPSIIKLSACPNAEAFLEDRTSGKTKANSLRKVLRKRATEVGLAAKQLGQKAIDKAKDKARLSHPPPLSTSSKASLNDDKCILPVISSSLIVHAGPSLIKKCFFDIQYFENLSKAKKSLVHEYKENSDIIAYWYEKFTYRGSGYKANEYLARYAAKQEGTNFIIAFKNVEETDVPYIFEKANIPSNKILRVKATGHYHIVALAHGQSRIDFTATLNPVYGSDNMIANQANFKNEIWSFVQPLLRIRSDFDRSEEVDLALFKEFIDQKVDNPVSLSEFDEEIVMKALQYRAEDDDGVSNVGRRNSLREKVLINARQISKKSLGSNNDTSPLSYGLTNQISQYMEEKSQMDPFSNINDAFEVSNIDELENGEIEERRGKMSSLTRVEEKALEAAIETRDQIRNLEGEFLNTGWQRMKQKGADAASRTGPELFKREGFDDNNQARNWHKGVLTIATTAKNALSYIWHVTGNERMKIHEAEAEGLNLPRCRYSIPNSRSQIVLDSKRFPVNVKNRIFETYQVWDLVQDENGHDCYIVVWEPAKEVGTSHYRAAQKSFVVNKKDFVEGTLRGITLIKKLAPNVCEVTIIANIQNNGYHLLPSWIGDLKMREAMDLLDDLQSKYQRNWSLVDHEIRTAFSEKNFSTPEDEEAQSAVDVNRVMVLDQLECSKECFQLLSDDNDLGKSIEPKDLTAKKLWDEFKAMMEDGKETAFDWSAIPSPDPLVELVHGHKKKGAHRGHYFCRGRSFVDASVGETAAYYFLVNLQTNMNSFLDAGHLVRNVSSANGVNDQIVGSVYNLGSWFLASREIVSRWLWGRVDNKIIIWMKCINHLEVDYSVKVTTTKRIEADQILVIEPQILNEVERGSRVTHFSCLSDISSLIPRYWVRNMFAKAALQVSSVRKEFSHNDSVDDEMLNNFLEELYEEDDINQHITDEEEEHLERVNIMKHHTDAANFKTFNTSYNKDFFVDLKRKQTEGTSLYKATCIMDSSVDECLFTEYCKNTRQALEDAYSEEAGVLNLSVKKLTRHSQLSVVEKRVKKIKMKAVEQIVWKRFEDGRAVVGYGATDKEMWPQEGWDVHTNSCFPGEASASARSQTVNFKEFVELKVLPPIGDVYQTKATFMIELPKERERDNLAMRELFIMQRLHKISQFRIRLSKNKEIDTFYRSELAKKLVEWNTDDNMKYADHEQIIISQGVTLLSIFENSRRGSLQMDCITSTENETTILNESHANIGYKGYVFTGGSPTGIRSRRNMSSSSSRFGRATRAFTSTFKSSASINPSSSNASIDSARSSGTASSLFSDKLGSGPMYKMTFKGNEKDKLLLTDLRVRDSNKNLLKSYKVWSRCRAVVNGRIEDVMSYFWDFQSRCRIRTDDLERMTIEIKSDHNIIGCITSLDPSGETTENIFEMVWYKIDPQNMCIICFPVDHYSRSGRGFKRLKNIWIVSTKAIGDGSKCRMSYLTSYEYDKKARPQTLMSAIKCQRYFLGLKDLRDCDELIGHGLGEAFMTMSAAETMLCRKNAKLRVQEVVEKHKALDHLSTTYPWFVALMEGIVENKIEVNTSFVNVNTHDLSNRQARMIGGTLSFSMLTCLLPTSAVDEWIMRSTALQEFDVQYSWFRPMIDCMAYALLDEAHWGLAARVVVGACISLSDIFSDVFMILYFFHEEENNVWWILTCSFISLSMLLQLVIVHVNGRKNQLKEKLIVLLCLKPAVDAYRVVQVDETDFDSDSKVILDSVTEAVFCKCVEMLFESIPSSIIQAIFYLSASDDLRMAPLISIGFSCMSTGYIMTSITYDLDIDPETRKKYDQHGIIPNSARRRGISFTSLLIISSVACFQTSFAFASLVWADTTVVVAFFVVGYVPYIAFKGGLMKDWSSWINLSGRGAFFTATMHRMVTKILNDFTYTPLFGDCSEMGRVWFPSVLLGIALNWMVCKNASIALGENATLNANESHLTVYDIWFYSTVGISFGFLIFFWKGCKWDKVGQNLFWQGTGPSMYIKAWHQGRDEEKMKLILDYNPAMFRSIAQEVKEWIQDSFERWIDEETFHASTLVHIPREFIPDELLEEREAEESRSSDVLRGDLSAKLSAMATQSRLVSATSAISIKRSGSRNGSRKGALNFNIKVRDWSLSNTDPTTLAPDGMDKRLMELNEGRVPKPKKGARRASNFALASAKAPPKPAPADFTARRRMSDKIRRDSRIERRKHERSAYERRMST
ncbi:hypothetical protein TrST_g13378 [Triparma strigata]|uniref:Uncharacterized protein n=1 Tax=Triparma strigata TaxID=1606541 RepID=A0A9W7C744_9STRA|nr:hypothetical protein TrST_g13378 [Triparma strigata]